MRSRLLVASLVLAVASTLVALPAQGKPPAPSPATATVTLTPGGGCLVTVTYAWSGFKGRGLAALYGVRWAGPGGTVFGINVQEYPIGSSGSASHQFDLSGHGTHVFYAGGELLDAKGRRLDDSSVRSTNDTTLSC
jgi:hypothetical protein